MNQMTHSLSDMSQKFQTRVCNQFLIYGNIGDYLAFSSGYVNLKEYLLHMLKSLKMDLVVFYDISAGLQFPNKNHEMKFREIMGFCKPKPNLTENELRSLSPEQRCELEKSLQELEDAPLPELPADPPTVFRLVEKLVSELLLEESGPKRIVRFALVVDYAETVAPAETGNLSAQDRMNTVALRRLADETIAKESVVILIARHLPDIHASLRGRGSRLKSVEIPLPRESERKKFIADLSARFPKNAKSASEQNLVHNTGGLSLREIEDVWKQFPDVTIEVISREKSAYIDAECGEAIRVTEPRFGLDDGLGGLEHIKEYCWEIKRALANGDRRLVPPGIILMGPPGTGKTALSEALAFEWGVPFVEILNQRSMWLGESERIALKIMSVLQSLSPCVLFCDEFDQEEAPRGSYQGDSGVSARIRKIRFQATSDPANRGKFLFLSATNRPELLDIADKRSGRGSVRIPMILPDLEEQEKIFLVMPARYDFTTNFHGFSTIVKLLNVRHGEFITGADIEEISCIAYARSRQQNHSSVTEDDYLFACHDFVPHPYSGTLIREMEVRAVQERSNNRFLSRRGKEIIERWRKERTQ